MDDLMQKSTRLALSGLRICGALVFSFFTIAFVTALVIDPLIEAFGI